MVRAKDARRGGGATLSIFRYRVIRYFDNTRPPRATFADEMGELLTRDKSFLDMTGKAIGIYLSQMDHRCPQFPQELRPDEIIKSVFITLNRVA